MNRIEHLFMDDLPSDYGHTYSFEEIRAILQGYKQNPGGLVCPVCGPGTMSVIAYFDPASYAHDSAFVTAPTGTYAVVTHCHSCKRSIGLLLKDEDYN